MAPVKRKLSNKSLAEKYKDVAIKYGVPRNTVLTWVENKHKLTASLEEKANELLTKKYAL